MKTILITNDDGIEAGGIVRLAEAAAEFGEVWVVAPARQMSAVSHSITLHSPLDIYPHIFPVPGVRAYSCSGTPGDCVRTGSLSILPRRPDVVLSGINYGFNVASDIQYSATAGAAFEAAFQGLPAIAFSEEALPCHETADRYLKELLEELLQVRPEPGCILNVNFPGCPLEQCRGILRGRRVSRGMIFRDHYRELEKLPDGGVRLMVEGVRDESAEEGTDLRAVTEGYVSVGIVKNIGY